MNLCRTTIRRFRRCLSNKQIHSWRHLSHRTTVWRAKPSCQSCARAKRHFRARGLQAPRVMNVELLWHPTRTIFTLWNRSYFRYSPTKICLNRKSKTMRPSCCAFLTSQPLKKSWRSLGINHAQVHSLAPQPRTKSITCHSPVPSTLWENLDAWLLTSDHLKRHKETLLARRSVIKSAQLSSRFRIIITK